MAVSLSTENALTSLDERKFSFLLLRAGRNDFHRKLAEYAKDFFASEQKDAAGRS